CHFPDSLPVQFLPAGCGAGAGDSPSIDALLPKVFCPTPRASYSTTRPPQGQRDRVLPPPDPGAVDEGQGTDCTGFPRVAAVGEQGDGLTSSGANRVEVAVCQLGSGSWQAVNFLLQKELAVWWPHCQVACPAAWAGGYPRLAGRDSEGQRSRRGTGEVRSNSGCWRSQSTASQRSVNGRRPPG